MPGRPGPVIGEIVSRRRLILEVLGKRVDRAAALLPQTDTAPLFRVSGGRIRLIAVLGEITVLFPATPNTVKLVATPLSGAAADLCSATSIPNRPVNQFISWLGAGTALSIPGAPTAGVTRFAGGGKYGIVVPGTIDVSTTGSSATGQVKWTVWYVPYEGNRAKVVPA